MLCTTPVGGVVEEEDTMDVGKSFSFVFEDPRWVSKVLIGGLMVLLSFLIVPGLIGIGYAAQLIRNVINGQERPLPEWSDMGAYLVDGAKLFVVYFVYIIPVFLLVFLIVAVAIATSATNPRGEPSGVALTLLIATTYCIAPIYSIALSLITPAFVGRYVMTNSIGAALNFGEVWQLTRANITNYLIALVVYFGASIAASFGIIICFIGYGFTLFYAYLVWSHMIGQAHRSALGLNPPAAPPTLPAPL